MSEEEGGPVSGRGERCGMAGGKRGAGKARHRKKVAASHQISGCSVTYSCRFLPSAGEPKNNFLAIGRDYMGYLKHYEHFPGVMAIMEE